MQYTSFELCTAHRALSWDTIPYVRPFHCLTRQFGCARVLSRLITRGSYSYTRASRRTYGLSLRHNQPIATALLSRLGYCYSLHSLRSRPTLGVNRTIRHASEVVGWWTNATYEGPPCLGVAVDPNGIFRVLDTYRNPIDSVSFFCESVLVSLPELNAESV